MNSRKPGNVYFPALSPFFFLSVKLRRHIAKSSHRDKL